MISKPSATPPSTMAAVDLRAGGVWAAVQTAGQTISCDLNEWGLTPPSLVVPFHEEASVPGEAAVPRFYSLLAQLNCPQEVSLADLPPQTPLVHVENLLARLTAGLRAGWGSSLSELCLLVPTQAGERQRSQLVRTAEELGWRRVRLINRTTAVAVAALAQQSPGLYAIAMLGQDPLELTIVDWGAKSVKALAHASAAEVSGSVLDALLTRHVLKEFRQVTGQRVDVGLYSDREWLQLRRQLQQARGRLNVYGAVSLDVPASLTEGQSVRVQIQQDRWREWIAQMMAGFPPALERLCREANTTVADLAGCVVSGSVFSMSTVYGELQRQCEQLPLIVAGQSACIDGAISWMATERRQGHVDGAFDAGGAAKPLPALEHAYVADDSACGVAAPTPDDGIDAMGFATIKELIQSGRITDARNAVERLKARVDGFEEALNAMGSDGQAAVKPAPTPSPAIPTKQDSAKSATARPADDAAAKRALYRAKEEIRKAQRALKQGQLEQAVGLSHAADQHSKDPMIFQAMIKVHLRAAQKDEPKHANFDDHRRWIRCALQDDPSNEEVQRALEDRYLIEVEELSEMGTPQAHKLAIETLHELAETIPMPELAADWLGQLKAGPPGGVRLSRASADASD